MAKTTLNDPEDAFAYLYMRWLWRKTIEVLKIPSEFFNTPNDIGLDGWKPSFCHSIHPNSDKIKGKTDQDRRKMPDSRPTFYGGCKKHRIFLQPHCSLENIRRSGRMFTSFNARAGFNDNKPPVLSRNCMTALGGICYCMLSAGKLRLSR